MSDTRTLSLTLTSSDAAAVAAMAAALALPADDFLSGVVAAWVAKPKNYRRFAKRLLGDDDGDRRKQVKAVTRSLKRRQRAATAKPGVNEKARTKPKAKAKPKRKTPAGVEAKRAEAAPQLAIAAPA